MGLAEFFEPEQTPSSREGLSGLLARTPVVIWTTDVELRYTLCRGGALNALNIGQNELEGMLVADTCEGREESPVYVAHQRALRGDVVMYETRSSGRTFIAHVEPIHDKAGNITGVFGSATDITDRRRTEQELRETNQRFRQLAENIREVFWMTNLEKTEMLYISPGYDVIWGRSGVDLYASPRQWLDAIHPQDRERVLEAAITKQMLGTYHEVYRIMRPDGSIRWIRDRAFVVRDDAGEPVRIAGVAEDITDLRRSEEQLRQTQKLDALGTLAAGVAHDFNNLLSVILTAATYAAQELGADHDLAVDLQEIKDASERAAHLTKQLLAFGRQQVVQKQPVDLNATLHGLDGLLRHAMRKDIELVYELAPDLSPILGDVSQIEQVVVNMAMNAVDAMPNPGKFTMRTADVSLGESAAAVVGLAPGAYVLLEVSDTGVGMARDTQSRMYEPFFSTKSRDKGTGLGLATVFGVVTQCGGAISVKSEIGEGSTFFLYFPPTTGAVRTKGKRTNGGTLSGSETILLVEDEERVRATARRILVKNGYRVIEASNPAEGIDIARAHGGQIDLLLTDVIMPGMNGIQLAHRLSEMRPDMKVLCMSGYADEAALARGLVDAKIAFLQKPLTPEALSRKVREVLNG
jgi:PAS domain S-box-containing protein